MNSVKSVLNENYITGIGYEFQTIGTCHGHCCWSGCFKDSAVAHHAFSAEFDANLPVRLGGPITRVEWINLTHGYTLIILMLRRLVILGCGWVEGGTPNTLLRRG